MTTQWADDDTDPGDSDMPLGDRIRTIRKEHNWSQGDLANKIGADAGQISRYENGKMTPGAAAVVKIAEALNISCDYLLTDHAPRQPFRTPPGTLHNDQLTGLNELDNTDRTALLHILDALIANNRIRHTLNDNDGD